MPGVTASKTYQPFDLVYEEQAFAWVLSRRKKDEGCDYCLKRSEDLITCQECSEVKYCGAECEVKNQAIHQMECGRMRYLNEQSAFPDDFTRLVARVIFEVKGKDWKEIKRNVMGEDVSFEDIDSYYEDMTAKPKLRFFFKAVQAALKAFLGEENLPPENDLIKIVGKVKYSSDNLSDSDELFCFGMSMFDHECIPNSNMDSAGSTMKVWANKKINKDTDKVTVSRRSILTTRNIRAPINDDTLEFCKCTECTLPYGDSVLTKIINKEEAYSVIRMCEKVLKSAKVLSAMDMEDNIKLRVLVDHALEVQESVLGRTNATHLKLLAVRAMTVPSPVQQRKAYLKELEIQLTNIFGEYSTHLIPIFKGLVVVNFELSSLMEAALYMKKIERLEIYQS